MVTLKDVMDDYMRERMDSPDAQGLKRCTERILAVLGDTDVSGMTTADVMRVKQALRKSLKPATINKTLKVWRAAWNVQRKEFGNPMPELYFKMDKARHKTRTISEEQFDDISTDLVFSGMRDTYHLFLFLWDTGCRLNEALAVKWDDFDWNNNTVTIYRSKTDSYSLLPVTGRLRSILKGRPKTYPPFNDAHIPSLRNTIDQFCNGPEFKEDIERHGRATIHSIRDTFATRMLRGGMSLIGVSKLLGHKSINTTMKYAHLEASDMTELARTILEKDDG